MRVFETSVQELKHEVLRSVARLAWHDNLDRHFGYPGGDHPRP